MTAGTEQVSSWDSGARLALGSQGVQALSRVCCTHHLVVIYSVSSPSNELMLKVATLRDTTFLRPCHNHTTAWLCMRRGICLVQISEVVGAETVLHLPSA